MLFRKQYVDEGVDWYLLTTKLTINEKENDE